jgi:acylphosphatase
MDKSVVIAGSRVHGVGFRPFLLAKARRSGLVRFEAENVSLEGKQAISVSFGGEKRDVAEFLEFCKKSHPHDAEVSGVSEKDAPARVLSIEVYDKILSAEQQSTMVRSGLRMIGLQEKTIEKLDEFHSDTVARFDLVESNFERTIKNIERMLDEMKEDRMESRRSTERIITMISSMRPGGLVRERPAAYSAVKKAKGTRKK